MCVVWELHVHVEGRGRRGRGVVAAYTLVFVYEAVNLSCPAPSRNTDSPLRRTLQGKIATPTDKHTLVSVQTHTLRQMEKVFAFKLKRVFFVCVRVT